MPEILATYDFTYASNAYSVTCNNKASATRAVVPKSYDDGSHGEYPVKTISASAFSGCTTLTTLVVPSSITSMGDSAFNGCSSLESVTLLGETPATLGTNVFAGTSANIKFYCTQSSLATYKAASGWGTYKDNMFGDDLRIYFEMNAIYAKDYFASKEYTNNTYVPQNRTINSKALSSDVSLNYVDVGALPDYTLSIKNNSSGVHATKFITVDYSTYNENKGCYFKLGAMCCHGNGFSYQFLEDIIIGVNAGATNIACNVYKYKQQVCTYNGVTRYYGDVFYVKDTTNSKVTFYILAGQYSTQNFTPLTKIGATTLDGVTQHTGTAVDYSSGTKSWGGGNATTYATESYVNTSLGNYLPKTGGTLTGDLIINAPHRDTYYASNLCRHFSSNTPTQYVIKTKIKFVSSTHMPVIRIYGYAYGNQCPIELRLGFYIYDNTLGWSGAVCTGSWKPEIYLFKYTANSVDYVAVGFKGACYCCGFQVDAQIGASGSFGSDFSIDGWTTANNGTDTSVNLIPAVGTDKCVQVPYKSMKTSISGSSTSISDGTTSWTPSELTSKFNDYLPLSGGTLYSTSSDILTLKRNNADGGALISYKNKNQDTKFWQVGMAADDNFIFAYSSDSAATTVRNFIITASGDVVVRNNLTDGNGTNSVSVANIASKTYVDTAIAALPEPMIFKGTLGTGGTITSLPTPSSSNEGWTYKVITAGTYAGQAAKVGDVFISNGTDWNLIPSGDEPSGTVTNVAAGAGLTTLTGDPITTSGTIKAALVNETKSTNASSYTAGGASKFYSAQLDKDGKLATYVPWTDNDHYPTAFTWTNGTSAGPTGSLTGNSGFTAVSFGAIPSASDTQSGVLTNQSQTIGGLKIFKGNLAVMSGNNTVQLSAETSTSGSSAYNAKLPLKNGTIAMTDQLPTIARYI